MALESVTAAETLIQSNAENDDLEDGEIPSDEDDEETGPATVPPKPVSELPKPAKSAAKPDSPKHKSFDLKFVKSKKPSGGGGSISGGTNSKQERFGKYKNPSEDWAGDVEKAIRAVLEEQDRKKGQDNSKSKSKSNRSKNRKRAREEKEGDRAKEQKKRKLSDEENGNEDDDEMVFVRGASPVSRRDGHDTTRSPQRRSIDRDNYDPVSDDERPNDRRQRDNDVNKRGGGSSGGGGGGGGGTGRGSGRRGGKTDRAGKNKGRQQQRNDRNGRRNQNNDHNQDPDAICLYYMQGKCHRGDDCPFSHNALPPRKMELCKFYLMDCCAKRDKCLYMHHDFPCKFYHTGLKCINPENCKFSHQPLSEQVKNILLKHLETAPKEILGDFPRLSRDSALLMINNTARNSGNSGQPQETGNQKIPSLFDVALPVPANSDDQEHDECQENGTTTNVTSDPNLAIALQQKRPASAAASSSGKERKQSGKKTRWGSDDDRVPYEQIMLLQSVSQLNLQNVPLGINVSNVALGLAVQQQFQQQLQRQIQIQQYIANMEFYNEIHGNQPEPEVVKDKTKNKDKEDFTKDVEEDEILAQAHVKTDKTSDTTASKDVDLRQILNASKAPVVTPPSDEMAGLETSRFDDESDRDEETTLVIEMPFDYEDKNKDEERDNAIVTTKTNSRTEGANQKKPVTDGQPQVAEEKEKDGLSKSSKSPGTDVPASTEPQRFEEREIARSLPKKAHELFMRIQQQQRTAKDSLTIADDQGEVKEAEKNENWYSDDDEDGENEDEDEDDEDDDEAGNLTIVLKDTLKEESDRADDEMSRTPNDDKEKIVADPSGIPQPVVFVDKLGDLSKIDISAEVTKLLSSIRPHDSKCNLVLSDSSATKLETRGEDNHSKLGSGRASRESSGNSPLSSPRNSVDVGNRFKSSATSLLMRGNASNLLKIDNENSSPTSSSEHAGVASVSRDPRMSRDPRQRREDQKSTGPSRTDPKKDSRPLRMETSIYSSGITAMDATMDTDLRAHLDQDHRRKDMDLRQRFAHQDYGDTDLRLVGTNFGEASSSRSDVDLRQMLNLPFKPAPSHVPCTEIDASASSHPPFTYKVYVVDIPRPDYTGLKLSQNDAQVKYDPRLRKIFRLPKVDIADSPMSPPSAGQQSAAKSETPKSPPQPTVRSDPRRKALEVSNQGPQTAIGGSSAVGGCAMMHHLQGQAMGCQQQQQQHTQQPEPMPGGPGMGVMGGVQGMQGPPGMVGMPPISQNSMMGGIGGPGIGQIMGGPMSLPPPPAPIGMGPGGPGMVPSGNGPMPPNQMSYDPRYAAQRNGGPGLLGPAPGLGYGSDVGPTGYDGSPGYPGHPGHAGPGNFSNYGHGPGPADPGMMPFGPNRANSGSFGGNVPPAEWTTANQNPMRRGNRIKRRNRNRTNTGSNNRGTRSSP